MRINGIQFIRDGGSIPDLLVGLLYGERDLSCAFLWLDTPQDHLFWEAQYDWDNNENRLNSEGFAIIYHALVCYENAKLEYAA